MSEAQARDRRQTPAPPARFIAHQRDAPHALAVQLAQQVGNRQGAVDGLPPGHGHRVVVENLVGDVHAGRDGRADRENSRVKVGAVTQVLKHVRGVGKRRLPDPGHAFTAHLGKSQRRSIGHPGGHVMAADAAQRMAALGQARRGVMRAPRAEVGHALGHVRGPGEGTLLVFDPANPCLHARRRVETTDSRRDRQGHDRRCEFAAIGQQIASVLVELAHNPRARRDGIVVELPRELVFDDGAFFFHDEDFLQTVGEVVGRLGLQRPGHADLVHAQTDLGGHGGADAHVFQRLHHIQIRFAGGDNAQARAGAIEHHAI